MEFVIRSRANGMGERRIKWGSGTSRVRLADALSILDGNFSTVNEVLRGFASSSCKNRVKS